MAPMEEGLPRFRYHPDPLATGSIEQSHDQCIACGHRRGFKYVGPVYAEEDLDGRLCPWCIADGNAARTFDAEFTDVGWGVPAQVPASVTDELAHRTPGFHSWQQAHWLYHCGDGCGFIGEVGRAELAGYPDASETLRRESEGFGWDEQEIAAFLDSLAKGGSPAAYLSRCLVCGSHLAYSDFD